MGHFIDLFFVAAALSVFGMVALRILVLELIILTVLVIAFALYDWLCMFIKILWRDITAIWNYLRLLIYIKIHSRQNHTVADIFQKTAARHPTKVAIIFEDDKWTFKDIDDYSNKIANVFKNQGYKKGNVVSLFLENKPEFVCIWLGLSKLGIIVALINTNQRSDQLAHSLIVTKCRALIFGTELTDAVLAIRHQIKNKMVLYGVRGTTTAAMPFIAKRRVLDLNASLNNETTSPPVVHKTSPRFLLLYIFTSGTSASPKPAIINNARYMFLAAGMHFMLGFKTADRFYTPLPLFHTAAGCTTVGQMLLFGNTIVITKSFVPSRFFPDCKQNKCTIAQYIGEMCRFLLAVRFKHTDTSHQLRMVFGNGFRAAIWAPFVTRFKIPQVAEFYGSTEGNVNIVNTDNTVGAIGFINQVFPRMNPVSVIRIDPATGAVLRNSFGFCIPCEPNQPGVFIGEITSHPSRAFLGYVDRMASERKIVRHVFKEGDLAFLSEDIVTVDELGYVFFLHRAGLKIRCRGQIVFSFEVEEVLLSVLDYKDVVVYGVDIQEWDTSVCMAAILDPRNTVNLNQLARKLRSILPLQAHPVFIRKLRNMEMTGTYKLKSAELSDEGVDPNVVEDLIYYLNNQGVYTLLTNEAFVGIMQGVITL